jgi:hypothetical protein
VLEGLSYRECVHFPSLFVAAVFDGRFQKMPGCLDGQRIGDATPGAPSILDPGWMRQRDPNWPPAGQEFDVHGIGVTGGNGYDQSLVNTVESLSTPPVGNVKVLIHAD